MSETKDIRERIGDALEELDGLEQPGPLQPPVLHCVGSDLADLLRDVLREANNEIGSLRMAIDADGRRWAAKETTS